MKNGIKFLLFLIYSTSIFFFPNHQIVLVFLFFNLLAMTLMRKHAKDISIRTFKILPFILFTFIINCLLDNLVNALWVGIKLLLVCNITIIYSKTTTVTGIAETIQLLCTPLKIFKINTEEIKIMICISLAMIPILKKDLNEMKEACKAKNISFHVKNIKYFLSKFTLSMIKRVNEIEEALIAKGYDN